MTRFLAGEHLARSSGHLQHRIQAAARLPAAPHTAPATGLSFPGHAEIGHGELEPATAQEAHLGLAPAPVAERALVALNFVEVQRLGRRRADTADADGRHTPGRNAGLGKGRAGDAAGRYSLAERSCSRQSRS